MRIFYCYSPKLRDELRNSGFKPLHKGINEKAGNPFWAYEGNTELNNFLDERRKKFKK